MAIAYCVCSADSRGREQVLHGTPAFPIACYEEDIDQVFVPWHWHEEFEVISVMEGACLVCLEGRRLELQAGQGIFINSQVLHSVEKLRPGSTNIRSLVFHPKLIGGGSDSVFWQSLVRPLLLPGAEHMLLDGQSPWHSHALGLLNRGWEAVAREEAGYEIETRYCLSEAFRILTLHRPQSPKGRQNPLAAQRMKTVLRFLEEHYGEELTVEGIAATVGLSESACLRLFRQCLDTSPIQYLKQYRLERAAGLLQTTRLSVSDIAIRCGFSDTSYFTRSFRTETGMTPKAYRALHRQENVMGTGKG